MRELPRVHAVNRPINILHTRVVTGAGGGPDKTILRSAAGLDHERYQAAACYLHPAGDTGIDTLRGHAARFGMAMHSIPERGALDRRTVRMMLDLCRRLHIDVWHSHDYKTDVLGVLLRRRHPMRLVTTVHGFTRETWKTAVYARINSLALLGYDRVIAVSPLLMRHGAECGVSPDRLRYVPNAIDTTEYKRRQTVGEAKYALGLPRDEHAIAVVARFSVEKGVDRAIRLFARVHRERPNSRLHLIGDGPQRTALDSLVDGLGLTYAVRWWGWQKDTRPILEAMDTLWLTSHTEGLPNAVLEAMALGVPVGSTRVGAVPDVLDQGRCGVLLDADQAAWPGQVLQLIDRPMVREQYATDAGARVAEHYDFRKRMGRVASIYDELMGTPFVERATLTVAA